MHCMAQSGCLPLFPILFQHCPKPRSLDLTSSSSSGSKLANGLFHFRETTSETGSQWDSKNVMHASERSAQVVVDFCHRDCSEPIIKTESVRCERTRHLLAGQAQVERFAFPYSAALRGRIDPGSANDASNTQEWPIGIVWTACACCGRPLHWSGTRTRQKTGLRCQGSAHSDSQPLPVAPHTWAPHRFF